MVPLGNVEPLAQPALDAIFLVHIGEEFLVDGFHALLRQRAGVFDRLAPAELKLAQEDEEMSKQIYSTFSDFRTFYLFFDVSKPPFDNLQVRQAFSHVIDRDAIQRRTTRSAAGIESANM